MGVIIEPEMFRSANALKWAPWLLGKVLVRTGRDGAVTRHVITETEAYNGERDLACHASRGRTARAEVLYRAGGIWYVYLCYGVHEMLNLVAGRDGFPSAVLIRGVREAEGPGRVTKRLGVGRSFNGARAEPASGLHVEDAGLKVPGKWIQRGPRVGVDYAGPVWAAKPWRFRIAPGWEGREG